MLILALATTLLGATSALVAARVGSHSLSTFLLAVYLVAFAEVVAISLLLSSVGLLTRPALLAAVALCFAAAAVTSLRFRPPWPPVRSALAGVLEALRDPLVAALAIVVVGALSYVTALALFTPQVDDDALYYHLARAAFWKQQQAIGYVDGIFDLRVNANPPNAEIASLFTMLVAGGDRFVGLVQLAALLASCLGIYRIGRRLGLATSPALFGALVFATLPVVALQASTALNDLVVASFLVAAAAFALSDSRAELAFAGLAVALAVGTKVTALFALPVLAAIALLAQPRRRWPAVIALGITSVAAGSYWYVVNAVNTGRPDGGLADGQTGGGGLAGVIARGAKLAIDTVEVPGAGGRDRLLYALAASIVLVGGAVAAFVRRHRPRAAAGVAAAAAIAALPLAFPSVGNLLFRGYVKAWLVADREDLAFLTLGKEATRATPMHSWYGPLGVLFVAAGVVLVILVVRQRALPRLAILLVVAPVVWLVMLAVAVEYSEWEGRFLMFPVALAASTWGLVLRRRPLAWATMAVGATTLVLALAHYEGKPSGLRLLEPAAGKAVWGEPRWRLQARRPEMAEVLRFVAEQIPAEATIGLAITPSDFTYPYFGHRLTRAVRFITDDRHLVPSEVEWLVVRPDRTVATCPGGWEVATGTREGWTILRRVASVECSLSLVAETG